MGVIRTSIQLYDGMTTGLRSMLNAMNSMISSFETLQSVSSNPIVDDNIRLAREELVNANNIICQITQNLDNARLGQDNLNRSIRNGGTAAGQLARLIKSFASIYFVIQGFKKIIQLTDQMTNTTARLDLVLNKFKDIEATTFNPKDISLTTSLSIDKSNIQKLEDMLIDFNINGVLQNPLQDFVIDISTNGMESSNQQMKDMEELQNKIFEASQRARAPYMQTADAIAKMGIRAGAIFESIDEVIAFSEQLNKKFAIAGASQQEMYSATLQLTQSLGSGVLRGEEFNAVFEAAPNIMQSIADYLGYDIGQMRKLASQGRISAKVIKDALLSTAAETNAQFASMPVTFQQAWTKFKNNVLKSFKPVLEMLGEVASSEEFESFLTGIANALAVMAVVITVAFGLLVNIGSVIYDNFDMLIPIILGVASAIAVYTIATKSAAAAGIIAKGATDAWKLAQAALNAVIALNPVFIIIIAVIMLIATIYALIAVENKMKDTTKSATGVIIGAFAVAGAFMANQFQALLKIVIGVIEFFYNGFIDFANFFANVFNDPIGSIIKLFGGFYDDIMGLIESIATAIDFVFGSNMGVTVAGWREEFNALTQNTFDKLSNGQYDEKYKKINIEEILSEYGIVLEHISYDYMGNLGYNLGDALDDKIGNAFNGLGLGLEVDYGGSLPLDKIMDGISETAGNTGRSADILEESEEDFKFLRDIAERENINQFTTAELSVTMNTEATINDSRDTNGLISEFTQAVYQSLVTMAEGGV